MKVCVVGNTKSILKYVRPSLQKLKPLKRYRYFKIDSKLPYMFRKSTIYFSNTLIHCWIHELCGMHGYRGLGLLSDFKIFIYLSCMCGGQRTILGAGSLPHPGRLNSGRQIWQQVPLPAEPALGFFFLIKKKKKI